MHMSNRTAKFVSAIFAGFLAGAPLTTISHSAARAADDCLSGPKDQTPQGGHWYYRIDRVTKRHCWYLGEEREKLSQIAPPNAASSANPVSPKTDAAMQRALADAHAELHAQTRIEQPDHGDDRPTPEIPTDAAAREDNRGARTSGAETPRSIVASRWPDPSGANPTANPAPNNAYPVTSVTPASRPLPPSVLAAGQFAAADLSSETPAYSVQMLLAALMAALALAGIMGSVIFKFGSAPRSAQAKIRERRGAIWEATDDDSILLSAHPGTDAAARRTGFARDLDEAHSPNDRIAEFFSQLSKRAPT
jgi:hypothetical protein